MSAVRRLRRYPGRYPVVVAAVLLLLWAIAAYAAPRSRSLLGGLLDRPTAVDPNAAVVVGFSPGAGGYRAEDVVLQAIDEARSSIHMAAYSFSSKSVATALLAAKRRGIDVMIVVDYKENKRKYSAATFTANQGIPTRTDDHYAIMHNKFLVVDGSNVETGSFNYTAAARDKNAENALLLRNVPGLAAIYDKEWRRLWQEAEPLAPRY
jgi:phosphatidylserine/phosphatidylglycerophosphate/cardiolipin synthase-like enzyme